MDYEARAGGGVTALGADVRGKGAGAGGTVLGWRSAGCGRRQISLSGWAVRLLVCAERVRESLHLRSEKGRE